MLPENVRSHVGLLLLRVSAGGLLLFGHGLRKLLNVPQIFEQFPNPIGLGSGPSAVLAIFAEFVCTIFVILGLFTRWAAVPPLIMLIVAGSIVHAADPWARKEFAYLFAVPFLTLFFTGGGRYSIDTLLRKKGTQHTAGK